MVQEDGGSNPLDHPIANPKTNLTRNPKKPLPATWETELTVPAAPAATPSEDVVTALPGEAPPAVPPPEVTEVGQFERRLTLLIDRPAMEKAKDAAARRLSRGVNIKGFRRGKAPRRMVENALGAERVRDEAIEIALPGLLGPALQAAQLVPAVTPSADNIRETEQGVKVDILISLWPVLDEPPVYEGRRFEIETFASTEEMVEINLERYLEQFAELETVDRPAEAGDYVAVNLHASRNGRPVEAASATDLLYEVGSGGLLEGLDANVTGRAAGDISQFATILPPAMTGGRQEDPVDMSVMVKEVRRKILPQIDDQWVADNTEYETEAEMRQGIADRLEEMGLEEMRNRLKEAALEGLMQESQVEIPQAVINAQAGKLMDDLLSSLREADHTFEAYLRSTGETHEKFQERLLYQTLYSLSKMILLDAVARHAGITVSDEEKEEFIRRLAPQVRETPEALAARLEGTEQERSILVNMMRSKAHDELARRVTAVDEDGNPIDLRFDPPPDPSPESPDPIPSAETD